MKAFIKSILARVGIRNKYDAVRYKQFILIKNKLEANPLQLKKREETQLIVFSKDRALQLDALLRSYYYYTENPVSVKVLYRDSSVEFEKAYAELIQLYSDRPIEFIQERSFKKDLVELFDRLTCSKVIFLVDDLQFKNRVNFKSFTSINPRENIASLRLGAHLNYAYTLNIKQPLPTFEKVGDMLSWNWKKSSGDWAYPLSVDGHLFDKEEFKVLVNELDYKAPNSFEEALQVMYPFFVTRNGLCFQNSVLINNPCNKVQSENDNVFGNASIEELNTKWLEGYRIDFQQFDQLRNESAHQELPLSFIER